MRQKRRRVVEGGRRGDEKMGRDEARRGKDMRFRECTFYRRKYEIGRVLIWQIENHFRRTD